MKLILKNPQNFIVKRLDILKLEIPCSDTHWHYHAQYELIYISKSFGIRFVGDNVSPFSAGDLVLVGPNLPHLWLNDSNCLKDKDCPSVQTIVMKFNENFIGEGTFNHPEFLEIKKMFEQAKYGICFGNSMSLDLHHQLLEIDYLSPSQQLVSFLNVLQKLSLTNDKHLLSSTDMRQYTTDNSERIDTILKYISDNYAREMSLNEIADIACMTTNSFCRFFKRMTNKSFTQFLNEVRIKNASRLLIQENLSIADVRYKVGFNSITNFNKQFKQIIGTTPKEYRTLI